jgi:hypothetical protein
MKKGYRARAQTAVHEEVMVVGKAVVHATPSFPFSPTCVWLVMLEMNVQ